MLVSIRWDDRPTDPVFYTIDFGDGLPEADRGGMRPDWIPGPVVKREV